MSRELSKVGEQDRDCRESVFQAEKNSKCKGPEVEVCSTYMKSSQEARLMGGW